MDINNPSHRLYVYGLCIDAGELETFYKYKQKKTGYNAWSKKDRQRIYHKAMFYRRIRGVK